MHPLLKPLAERYQLSIPRLKACLVEAALQAELEPVAPYRKPLSPRGRPWVAMPILIKTFQEYGPMTVSELIKRSGYSRSAVRRFTDRYCEVESYRSPPHGGAIKVLKLKDGV